MKTAETFVDSLLSASLKDGIVRLEFGEIEGTPGEGAEGEGRKSINATPKHRLLIPLPGFVRSLRIMQEVMKRIEEEQGRLQSDAQE